MNIMYLYRHELMLMLMLIFFVLMKKMASFRVTIVCFWNGCIRENNGKVHYVGGRCKLFACNSNMDLNHFRRFICSKIGLDPTRSTVNISFKYALSGEFIAFPVEDDEAIDAMWEQKFPLWSYT